ncbi:TonB-dependent receptor [Psychromonas sp. SP041]|uniref:TonB-dependent receptor plug domain-containing protein n=1 Tax=Psychromonas sp. SP041 TaxID=1365007 RepID=UPI0004715507|nr:TonB-dependent receptor [Psychromonas sp. SP041]
MHKFFSHKRYITAAILLSNTILMVNSVYAEDESVYVLEELPSLDFDALMAADVQVTSAMKRLQNMSETAASIYVLTNKEIRESGVTNVAQALKLVPGMQVRQLDNNQWAITSRSTAGKHSSKLLVMVDGQSIYNPGFAGVYWEALNIPLYDIERIEVIRGQGGLLWGSNATNGVINIISKHSADTLGVYAQATTGTKIDHKVDFRIGGDLGNYSSFRIFASSEETDVATKSTKSTSANDDGRKKSVGGRLDLSLNDDLSFIVQAQYTSINMGQNLRLADLDTYQRVYLQDQYTREHFQFMTRLEQTLSSTSNQMLQASISSQQGEQLYYKDDFVITDVDYQMNTLIKDIQIDWGVNYRYTSISIDETDYFTNIQDVDSYNHFGGFLQVQFTLLPDELKLIIGNRSEKNSFTGWGHQPMARLLWTPHSKHTIWAAISQGVRIPSLLEYNNRALASSSGIKTEIVGNADLKSEKSISKELGYRYTENSWGIDVSLFHTEARNVLAVEAIPNATFTLINLNFVSDADLTTYGGEAVIKWKPFDKITTELGYSITAYEYDLPQGTTEAIGFDSYLRQVIVKSQYALNPEHSIAAIYRIESGEAYDTNDFSVLDLTWNWQITPSVAFSLTGNNLLYGKHLEYNNTNETYTVPTYIEPNYFAKITAKF